MQILQDKFSRAYRLIREKKKILLVTHEHPDGDALGSLLGTFGVLSCLAGKDIAMFSKDPIPLRLRFLPFWEKIEDHIRFVPDLVLAFDYGSFHRLGIKREMLGGALIIAFDHHPVGRQEGDVSIIDTASSSTCEILYWFFEEQGYRMNLQVATALLTGILTDTGGFAHVNTSVRTFEAAADLLRYGPSLPRIHQRIFETKTLQQIRAWGRALKNLVIDEETSMAYAAISLGQLQQLGCSPHDFEGVVNILQMPSQARFSLLLIEERRGFIRGSLRSEPFKGVDVSKVAGSLGGGGHRYAAGFERTGETIEHVVKLVKRVAMYPSG